MWNSGRGRFQICLNQIILKCAAIKEADAVRESKIQQGTVLGNAGSCNAQTQRLIVPQPKPHGIPQKLALAAGG